MVGSLFAFFFFQAEDGIRDVAVTGVQTCALPISTHNTIRGGISFEPILGGIRSAVGSAPEPRRVSIRTVVQKQNFRELAQLIGLAKSLGVGRISFLAADLLSDGFGRNGNGLPAPSDSISLTADEVSEFREIVDA